MRRPDRIDSRTDNPASGQSAGLYPDDPEQRPPGTPCARRTNPVRSQAIRYGRKQSAPLPRPPQLLGTAAADPPLRKHPAPRHSDPTRALLNTSPQPRRHSGPAFAQTGSRTTARRIGGRNPAGRSRRTNQRQPVRTIPKRQPEHLRHLAARRPARPTKRRRLPISGTAARHGHTGTIRLHVSNPTNRPVCRVIRMRFHALCARSRGCQSAETQELRILRSPFSGRRRRTCGSRWRPHARG